MIESMRIPCLIVMMAVIVIVAAAILFKRIFFAKKWRDIARQKGYEGDELKKYYKLALLYPKQAQPMIIALPDKNARRKKGRNRKNDRR